MKIKNKLVFGSLGLVFGSLLLVTLVSNMVTSNMVSDTVDSLTRSKLESILALKKRQIESYLIGLRKQVQLMALDQNSGSAAFHFDSTLDILEQNTSFSEQKKQALMAYYTEAFKTPFDQQNSQPAKTAEQFYGEMDVNAMTLQYHYIVDNPNPVTEKYKMESPINDFSSYSSAHAGYHRSFIGYAEKLGFGDVFLIGPEGRVNYSLKKGFELGTNLKDGPFADTGLARVFSKALTLEQGQLAFEDFAAYSPMYNAPAAFIATPFIKFKRIRGVLVVQFPIDTIDGIMTDDQSWSKVGLGETGQAYLVGPDATLRSTSRLNVENFEQYIEALRSSGNYDQETLEQVQARGTGIGLQQVKTSAAERAFSGESGFEVITSKNNTRVLSTYAPINVEGFDWAILSEIDEAEAFSVLSELQASLSGTLVLLMVIVMVVAALFILFLARSIFHPIDRIASSMHEISEGNASLASRLDDSGNNEMAAFAESFNRFVAKLEYVVNAVTENSARLVEQSAALTQLSKTGKEQSEAQNQQIDAIDRSIKRISESIEQNSNRAQQAVSLAANANSKALDGRAATENAIDAIQSVATEVDKTTQVLSTLETDVNNVAEVLAVINSISDQTNLLALNAAIEAARAGEHGRGFAVVADEVRSLSHKIQSETHLIYETINKLSVASEQVVQAVSGSGKQVETGTGLSRNAGEAMDAVVSGSQEISDMNQEIAATTNEQTELVHQIKHSVQQSEMISVSSTEAAARIDDIGHNIESLARELGALVAQFEQNKQESDADAPDSVAQ